MKIEKTKLYKLFWFCKSPLDNGGTYLPINGLWHSAEEFFNFLDSFNKPSFKLTALHLRKCSFIKIPFFGYYSPQFTGYDPCALAGTRRPRI